MQDRTTPRTVNELVTEVKRAFWAKDCETFDRVLVTLHAILQEIMLARGDNTFKLPHLRKKTAARGIETLPRKLPSSPEA